MKSPRKNDDKPFELEPGWALYRHSDGSLSKIQIGDVSAPMIEAAEDVEDLYKRGTPHTWGSVFRRMLANADQAPVPQDALKMERRLRWVLEQAEMTSSSRGDNFWKLRELAFDAAGDIGKLHLDDKFREMIAAIDVELERLDLDATPTNSF